MSKKIFVPMRIDSQDKDEIIQLQKNIASAVAENLHEKFEIKDEIKLIEPYINKDVSPIIFLAVNIKRLSEADFAVFFDDWEDERNCRLMRFCADEYDIQCIDVVPIEKGGEDDGERE